MSKPKNSLLRKLPWRTAFVVAVLVILCRWLVFETLVVPTDSMEPFLHGDPKDGDRVVVFKPAYWWGDPRRFETVVFKDPAVRRGEPLQYLVKRAVGFAGETIQVKNGDLYLLNGGKPVLLTKSYEVFQDILVDVYRGGFDSGLNQDFWIDGDHAQLVDGALLCHGPKDHAQALLCRYTGAIDSGFVDAAGVRRDGELAVHDVLLEVVFVPEDDRAGFIAQLDEGMDQFRFILHPGRVHGKAEIVHKKPNGLSYSTTASHGGLETGASVRIEVWNIDDVLGIAVDGNVLLTTQHVPVEKFLGARQVDPKFGVFGGLATFHSVRLRRDLHYAEVMDQPHQIRPGHLFVLGDFSERSRDSRHFGDIPAADLIGRPVAVLHPFDRMRLLD